MCVCVCYAQPFTLQQRSTKVNKGDSTVFIAQFKPALVKALEKCTSVVVWWFDLLSRPALFLSVCLRLCVSVGVCLSGRSVCLCVTCLCVLVFLVSVCMCVCVCYAQLFTLQQRSTKVNKGDSTVFIAQFKPALVNSHEKCTNVVVRWFV